MRTDKRIAALTFLRLAPALLLSIVAASSHAGSNAVRDADGSRISVTAVAGDVDFTMAGSAVTVTPDTTVLLPARIVTGRDGSVGLTQAGTKVSVANDTDVEIPAEAVDGNLIARLVQHRGNVFYDVAPRDLGKLRVETPFLVAVIKGTQFNVAVDEAGTTISLFEGSLEIRTPDDSDVIHLNAGEIAIRSLIDDSIRVVGMDDLRVAAPSPPAAARNDAAAASDGGATAADEAVATRVDEVAVGVDAKVESRVAARPQESTRVEVAVLTGIETKVNADLGVGQGRVDLLVEKDNPGMGVGRGRVDLPVEKDNPGVGVGHGRVEVGAIDVPVDFDRGTLELPVDVGLDTQLDIGAPSVDVDLDVRADIRGATDVGSDAGLDLGEALDVDFDTRLDLGTVVETLDIDPIDLTLDAAGELELDVDLQDTVDLDLDDDQGNDDLDLDLDRGRAPPPGGLLGALP